MRRAAMAAGLQGRNGKRWNAAPASRPRTGMPAWLRIAARRAGWRREVGPPALRRCVCGWQHGRHRSGRSAGSRRGVVPAGRRHRRVRRDGWSRGNGTPAPRRNGHVVRRAGGQPVRRRRSVARTGLRRRGGGVGWRTRRVRQGGYRCGCGCPRSALRRCARGLRCGCGIPASRRPAGATLRAALDAGASLPCPRPRHAVRRAVRAAPPRCRATAAGRLRWAGLPAGRHVVPAAGLGRNAARTALRPCRAARSGVARRCGRAAVPEPRHGARVLGQGCPATRQRGVRPGLSDRRGDGAGRRFRSDRRSDLGKTPWQDPGWGLSACARWTPPLTKRQCYTIARVKAPGALEPPILRGGARGAAGSAKQTSRYCPGTSLACPGTLLYGGLWATLRGSRTFFRLKTACRPCFARVPGQ